MFNTTVFRTTEKHEHIHFPDTIKEVKAPTDESIRLLNEMQQKTVDNIMAKVEVKDNLLTGKCYLINLAAMGYRDQFKMIFKFSINGQEFDLEQIIERQDLPWSDINDLERELGDYLKAVMLWWCLRKFSAICYEQITNSPAPKYLTDPKR